MAQLAEGKVQICAVISEHLLRRLDAECKRTGLSRSHIVNSSIELRYMMQDDMRSVIGERGFNWLQRRVLASDERIKRSFVKGAGDVLTEASL